jgi:alkylation response protein AidB-like acyl-CoA dehydrogenase
MRASSGERVVHAAQFVTEIQGGSDVGANAVEALPDGGAFRLHGAKWFCSNVNADWFLVSARPRGAPAGSKGVAIFSCPPTRATASRGATETMRGATATRSTG